MRNIRRYSEHIREAVSSRGGRRPAVVKDQGMKDPETLGRKLLTYLRERALAQGRHMTPPPYTKPMKGVEYVGMDVVKELIERGADVNVRHREDGTTPLHWACISYRAAGDRITRLVRILIDAGADVNAKDRRGSTPLRYAAEFNGVIVYINYQHIVNFKGDTPLRKEVALELINAGADIVQAFGSFENFADQFKGEIDWLPQDVLNRIATPEQVRRYLRKRGMAGMFGK